MIKNLLSQRQPDRVKQKHGQDLCEINILKSSSDWGTVLNNGRRGSFNAPEALLNQVFKMTDHDFIKSFSIKEVSDLVFEKLDFQKAQITESEKILKAISLKNKTLHIGGGHDHIFPILKAYQDLGLKNILVINIDPHLDTRTDSWHNSGTPFRNWDNISESKNNTLIQIGTHHFANGKTNYEPLKNIRHEVVDFLKLQTSTNDFTELNLRWLIEIIESIHFDYLFISLDVDAYQAESIKAVSAINQKGLSPLFIEKLFNVLKKYDHKTLGHGIYEFNPVFDDVSGTSARILSSLIYEEILKK